MAGQRVFVWLAKVLAFAAQNPEKNHFSSELSPEFTATPGSRR